MFPHRTVLSDLGSARARRCCLTISPPEPPQAIFRETGAQHFEKTGGFTSWDQGHPDTEQGCTCAALTDENRNSNTVTRRNDVIKGLLKEFPNVRMIPFYDLTVPQYDLHENAWCGAGAAVSRGAMRCALLRRCDAL